MSGPNEPTLDDQDGPLNTDVDYGVQTAPADESSTPFEMPTGCNIPTLP